ncbi:hypothetical protein BD410DRAFT_827625 [Rickenella mellea]|uniref:Uncharacterized protein n=1 Tax=Rickenella mellea TaxID=50990 RepID=A0A4Y7Q985_9AGAM|nr:hypothetical protein BD410DRAFT_827625 [Rickenella mellea]
MPTPFSKENHFDALERQASAHSNSFAPFSLSDPQARFKFHDVRRKVNLVNISRLSKSHLKQKMLQERDQAEARPVFKTVPLGYHGQLERHRSIYPSFSTYASIPPKEAIFNSPFPSPVIAWSSPSPYPYLSNSDEQPRTPSPSHAHLMEELFGASPVASLSPYTPSRARRQSSSIPDESPCSRRSVATPPSAKQTSDLQPRTQSPSQPPVPTAVESIAGKPVSNKEEVVDKIISVLVKSQSAWTPYTDLLRKMQPLLCTPFQVKEAFRDNTFLQRDAENQGKASGSEVA